VRVESPATGVGMVLLDAPPKNFGSYELLQDLYDGIGEVGASGAKVLVLASDVPGYLMAHAWLPDVLNAYENPAEITGNPLLWRMVAHELERGDMITISCNHGQAWGGGAELSWACNLRTAGESATYAQIESILGVVPGGGGTARLARLVGQSKALEILLAAEPFTARQLEALGLVNKVFADDELRERTIEWARLIATRPKRALLACKRGVLQTWDLDMENALRLEGYIFNSCMRPETLEIMRRVQDGYDAGADSWTVYGLAGRSDDAAG
jgi:enoyl-CoA hydratase/carnithine racemase